MSYRIQEIFRLIIPGFYLLFISFFILFPFFREKCSAEDFNFIKEIIKGPSNIIVLVLPFIAFVTGYLVDAVMSLFERSLYFVGFRRPSRTVLKGCSWYILHHREDIIKSLKVDKALCNKQCNEALQKAKQKIDRSTCSEFFFASILARNLFGAHFTIAILVWISYGFLSLNNVIAWILALFFFLYWGHKNHVYVKYVFAEYDKQILSSNH